MIDLLASEKFWVHKYLYDDAEKRYYEYGVKNYKTSNLVSEIAKARQHIRNSLEKIDGIPAISSGSIDFLERINAVEKENAVLRKMILYLEQRCSESTERINSLEDRFGL